MPGLSDTPVDGQQYSGLFKGVPVVLEYDASAGGYKLVVAQEYAVNFMVSGVIALETSDIEIGAVEIKDYTTDDRAHVDTSHLLHVCIASGTIWTIAVVLSDHVEDTPHTSGDVGNFNLSVRQDVHGPSGGDGDYVAFLSDQNGYLKVWTTGSHTFADTELPDAVALSDATATPTAPAVGAFGHAWDEIDETWDRLRNEGISGSYALRTSIMGETDDGFEHVSVDPDGHLQVDVLTTPYLDKDLDEVTAYVTGSVRIVDSDGDEAGVTDDGCLQVSVCTGTIVADTELPDAVALSDEFENPTAPAVGAFGMGYYPPSGTWSRLLVSDEGCLRTTICTGTVVPVSLESGDIEIGAVEIKDGDSDQRAGVTADGCLQVAVCTGSIVVGDGGGTISVDDGGGALTVDGSVTVQNLDKDSDEVTAYVTGSVRLVDSDGDEAGITSDGCLQVSICTGSVVVEGSVTADTELPAAAALADATATPTAPAVGSFGHAWDEVDSTWDRLRQEGASGSYALRTAMWGMAPAGYKPVVLDAAGHLQVDVLTAPALAKDTDEVTAYVTGTVRIVDSDGDEAKVTAAGCLQVAICTGTVVADVSLDQATDSVEAYLATDSEILLAGQTKTIERLPINITGTAGEYMLITGTAASQVHVMEIMLINSADTEVIFKSGWTGTWLTGPMSLPADGKGFFCGAPATPDNFHFQTETGEILVLEILGGARIGGWINWYDE